MLFRSVGMAIIGVLMMKNAIGNGIVKRKILVRHPGKFATGRNALIIGVIMAIVALIPVGGTVLALLDLMVRFRK